MFNRTLLCLFFSSLLITAACSSPGESVTKDTVSSAETVRGDAADPDAPRGDVKGDAPACTPECDGTHCGADNCGGRCTCPDDLPVCNDKAKCEAECVPECDLELGDPCGDNDEAEGDGCGGDCHCPENQECSGHNNQCWWTCGYLCSELYECGYEILEDCDCGECPDDGNPCTKESCEPQGESGELGVCVKVNADNSSCDDSDPCTTDDICSDAVCAGVGIECDDGNVCTSDSCDPDNGECLFDGGPLNGEECNDEDACTTDDACTEGVCAGVGKECDDNDLCTADSCDADSGECLHDAEGADGVECDDGNPCTGPDLCTEGQCAGELLPADELEVEKCLCWGDEDCEALDDGDICNGTLYCASTGDFPALCAVTPDSVPECDDGIPCTDDKCDPAEGCLSTPDNAVCDDVNDCTQDVCALGVGCENSAWDDGTPCGEPGGQDSCQQGTCTCMSACEGKVCGPDGCGGSCGDCPGPQDVCEGGLCVCQPSCGGKECGSDGCSGSCGECLEAQHECLDGLCTCMPMCEGKECGGDGCGLSCGECDWTQDCLEGLCSLKDCDFLCDGIQCGFMGPNDECNCGICDDGEQCTVDICNVDTAMCEFDTDSAHGLPCDDNNLCTVEDECVPGSGCEGTPVECDDGNECTLDFCDFLTGDCSFGSGGMQGSTCDDGNPCTSGDKCNFGECVGIPKAYEYVNVAECPCEVADDCAPYEDGSVCTGSLGCLEGDLGGHCYTDPSTVLDCNDDIECTTDTCHPVNGCQHAPNPFLCVDQASCTVDSCDLELGCLNTPDDSKCDDGNPCTAGWCDPEDSCTYAAMPEGFVCGDPVGWGRCSQNGICQCFPICPAEHACGDDSCGGSCGECEEWGYACVEGECIADCDAWCEIPECGVAGMWGECDCGDCDDGSDCTIDICGEDKKCRHVTEYKECDDGSACTENDQCVGGPHCVGTPAVDCDDDNPCTADSCDPATGLCLHDGSNMEGSSCDDGVPCIVDTVCNNGQCVGEAKTCDDNNDCTVDSCDEDTGQCDNGALINEDCDDGNPCTHGDICIGANCIGEPFSVSEAPPECHCINDFACWALEDGSVCNGFLHCDKVFDADVGVCKLVEGSIPDCDDGIDCTDDFCEPQGGCQHEVVHDVCDDGHDCTLNLCNVNNGCWFMGGPGGCDDDNECTVDFCDLDEGCTHEPVTNTTPCGTPEGWGNCQAGQCSCTSKCDGIECGDDGCGGTCGDCPGDDNECVLGECKCDPDCSGKECGSDGCGGYCGGCDWDTSDCSDDFKCDCFWVECGPICCREEEECVDGWCQNLINPPPVRLSWGEVTSTTMEIIMENDVPVVGIQLNYSILDATPSGGTVFEYFPFIFFSENVIGALGLGNVIPPGKEVLLNLEFDAVEGASGYCIVGDANLFIGEEGNLEYQMIPPCYFWGM